MSANILCLNITKTEYVLIGSRRKINDTDAQPRVKIDSQSVKRVKHVKVLGVQTRTQIGGNILNSLLVKYRQVLEL